jgi:hypothetical protein
MDDVNSKEDLNTTEDSALILKEWEYLTFKKNPDIYSTFT